ncbi:MAG: hypothetical protein J5I93_30320 [Pirellulaceae bacterium]|nr:hypothetical protein [Pirellulaceae bacterium]
MVLEAAGYRSWKEKLRPSWLACWPIARTGVVLVVRRKIFWLLLGLALINFLFFFAMIYLKAQLSVQHPGFRNFVDELLSSVSGKGKTYLEFMFAQGTVTMLLLAFAGETLIGADFRRGGLTFYLSRRITRWQYLLGKLLAIGVLVWMTTTLPALALYIEYGLLTDSLAYFGQNQRILLGILGYGLLLAVVLSLLLFALASWLRRTVPLIMSWACVFVFLPSVGGLLRSAFDDRRWLLLNLWDNVRLLGAWCFGALSGGDRELSVGALVIVGLVCLISAVTSIPRLRATQVVQ